MTQPQKKKPAVLVAAGCAVLALSTICCCGGGFGWRYWSAKSEAEDVALSFVAELRERRFTEAYARMPPYYREHCSARDFSRQILADLPELATRSAAGPTAESSSVYPEYAPRRGSVSFSDDVSGYIDVEFSDGGCWVKGASYQSAGASRITSFEYNGTQGCQGS